MKARSGVGMAALAVGGACASPAAGSRPNDMSAAQHEPAASARDAAARAHERQYDPSARAAPGSSKVALGQAANPTEPHRAKAEQYRVQAEQHRATAAALEAFAARQCQGLPAEAHGACPLLQPGITLSAVPHGLRLLLPAGMDAKDLVARIRFHQAFSRTVQGDGLAPCLLSVPNTHAEASADGLAVDILGDDPSGRSGVAAAGKPLSWQRGKDGEK